MATIRERKSSNGETSFHVQIRLKNFPTVTQSFARKTDAKRWAAKTEAAMREGRFFPERAAARRTLGELCERYAAEVSPTKKDAVKSARMMAWWKENHGFRALADLSPRVLADIRDGLAAKSIADGRRISGATVNRYLAALSHALTMASREWGWMADNPMRRVTRKKEARGRERFLADDERARLLEACAEGPAWLHPVVLLAMSTGMRLGEILALRWPDVDFGRKSIVVHESKNGERRAVPLAGAALATMREWSKVRRLDDDRVFPETRGFHHRWGEALARAKVEDLRFHDLRHTAASYLAMNGATLNDIAAVLGHKTLAMVKRYAHLSETHLADVVERMNRRYFG